MTFPIHKFGGSVEVSADPEGLTIRGPRELSKRENWPADALADSGAWRTSVEVEQLLELGFAEEHGGAVRIPYGNFEGIQCEMPVSVIGMWAPHSPFLLKIDRKSDLGRSDFQYRYTFLLAGRPVHVDRLGYYVRTAVSPGVFLLDFQMYSLLEAMDAFNSLAPGAKTPQTSWLTFAKVKGCAAEVGAALDSTLKNNDVIVPSALGLDMREDEDGALTFLPKCAELAEEDFHQVFERNAGAEKLYNLDRPGLGRVRIVLTDEQHQVLQRMKRVRRVKGELKERLKREPVQAFDGIADHIDLPYGDRVIGVGNFSFAPTPKAINTESALARLWQGGDAQQTVPSGETGGEAHVQGSGSIADVRGTGSGPIEATGAAEGVAPEGRPYMNSPAQEGARDTPGVPGKKYLLIETNEQSVRNEVVSEAENASRFPRDVAFERPRALREDRNLRPHQEEGIRWLQTCSQIEERTGVLLADDMGVGKTVQILTFLAWFIESGKIPSLSRNEPPFRPILIVAPLILVDTRTWESEMENFFANDGAVFWPVLSLHGDQLAKLRRDDAEGRELEIGKPILDLNRIQRNRVVITNYETVKSYQHSFAYMKDGQPIWSFIISDEAQEFKVPNTKISHAMKALKAEMHIACTGTPVENRLLDLWNICDALQPGLLSSAREFVERFEKNQGDGSQQNAPLLELKKTLLFQQPHAFLLRRTKSDVAELPPKSIVSLDCDMSDSEIAAHRALLRNLKSDSRQSRFLSVLQSFVQLYQHPAMLTENAEDLSVRELLSQSSKLRALLAKLHEIRGKREKVIIFARLRTMQGILAKVLQEEFHLPVRIINGETKLRAAGSLNTSGLKTRNAILHDFRSKPGFNMLILSPFVAGIGLTIVEANHVVHYGRWWNPAVESQATDRAYRIGQTKEVSVYLPILRDPSGRVSPTFDERLDLLMNRKQRLAEDFLRPLPPEDELGGELFTDLSAEAALEHCG